MSPEQIRGLEVDARSDLYSLGVTFYEALTGRLPFPPSDTGSEYEVFRGHIELAPPPIATVKPDVPEALAAVVMRSLQKDPGARFQSAAEFLNAVIDCEQRGAAPVARAASKPPQVTHSMTELISYDTRATPGAPSAPIQPPLATQAIEPAPTNQRATPAPGQQPRRYGLLVAGAFIALLVAAGVGFVVLKQTGLLSSAATTVTTTTPSPTPFLSVSTPTPDVTTSPTASPTPGVTPDDARLKDAREAEAKERYYDAIIIYGKYLLDNPPDTVPGSKEIQAHKTELEKFFGLINDGEFKNNIRDYAEAERSYTEALKLRPDSKLAQKGLKKAQSR
jgi:serine/threonine-protein kinase